MTAQILGSELSTLIQDSKRKNSELRNAAEKALQDLKALPVTSETQLTADLCRRPHFISPFLIACNSHNAKFASVGAACLQRLAVSRALPKERLTEVLETFKECANLGPDIQLKTLQALPSLLQNYPAELCGELLSTALQICSALQNTKNSAVSNTAAATLQQLVTHVFDKVSVEDERALEVPTVAEVPGDADPVSVRPAAYDAYKVFNDLNLLINGEKPAFIRFSSIPQTSGLELVESVLLNHGKILSTHPEQARILRTLLMPMITRSLSDRLAFPVTLRIIRILYLLIRNYLAIMTADFEISLGLLNHMLDPEASTIWKRALCLEVFRGLYSEPRLVLAIYDQFDGSEGKRCILGDNLAAFVRLATEKPAVIGLGHHSTLPTTRGESKDTASEQAAAEAGALAGVIGGPVSDVNHTGISAQWSSIKTPCIEQLDKSEAPNLPETYVYSLVLTCITNLSESLAKFILPLTVHSDSKSKKRNKTEGFPSEVEPSQQKPVPGSTSTRNRSLSTTQAYRKKNVPVNPLSLKNHSAHSSVLATSNLIHECWPAILATCSTFLNAALDTDYYRALVRAIQKFTHVAGLLRLSTPRDAFLTTLGKAAVPPNLLITNIASPRTPGPEQAGLFSNTRGLLSVESLSVEKAHRSSHEANTPALGPRNLLCLRALLNIAIALGPTLQSAWSIVFETLQVADLVIALANRQGGGREHRTLGLEGRVKDELPTEKVEAEATAVQAATRRLFESTVDFPNESFVEVLQALCALLHPAMPPENTTHAASSSVHPQILHQRRMGSVSSISLNAGTSARDSVFALHKIGELVALNESRLSQYEGTESGWNVFVSELVQCCGNSKTPTSTRLFAADILSRTAKEIAEQSRADGNRNKTQIRILSALRSQISALYETDLESTDSIDETQIQIHQMALEALKSVIEQCGESLIAGWDSVFASLFSVFVPARHTEAKKRQAAEPSGNTFIKSIRVISKPLARSAFGSVQLVCSDFLASVPDSSLATLLELLLKFCSQQDDVNMSLTTITFFWNVSDFLHIRSDLSSLANKFDAVLNQPREELDDLIKGGADLPMLWLQVLLHLSAVTTDSRVELRNSAVQTVQRIFENYEDQLSGDTWILCLQLVLFSMIESNLAAQTVIRRSNPSTDDIAAWNETTKTVLNSVSMLFLAYIYKMDDPTRLGDAWRDLIGHLSQFFSFGSHALGRSVFEAITGVLARVDKADILGMSSILETAFLWRSYFDHSQKWQQRPEGNQEAFLAYANAFKAIYRLGGESIDSHILSMLPNLEQCVVDSDDVAYSSDIDRMTPLQTQVMECLSLVRSDNPGVPSFLIKLLGKFCVLPYTSADPNSGRKSPTFIALSKASMSLLQTMTVKHIAEDDIYRSGSFGFALTSLVRSIEGKYIWKPDGKPPTLWQKATETVLLILKPGLAHMKVHDIRGDILRDIWSQVVRVSWGITTAQIPPNPPASLDSDEAFDINAFNKLRAMITPFLGSSVIPDALRRSYTRNLFQASLIHASEPGEASAITDSPLEDIYEIRFGHTKPTMPTLRTDMAYVCFSELISLVRARDGSAEAVKLSQAAAPYLILRAALPLKSYIADQPLRGRIPAPESQRGELMFTIEKMRGLESEPQSIPDIPGVKSKYKKHLHRIYPLLVQAMKAAVYDGEVLEKLIGIMDVVGTELGLHGDD
ncbi:hypothetical protein GQ43DRAFT_482079 [Delitschia confertaspora ATCC 74209]|uniref:Endosomal peripheral membrane protein n=1 Tax=Delitschia confertaspora ATCC 74209 TaxID=1513339 RepID=A0A9P4JNT3_9PLEO|nr:hypothetical protein GQ43DRAFT_482079 [Delitschia confertaspora ATCC 74209]